MKPETLAMNEHGSTTQNVIILSILVLIAILIALLLYRTVSDESTNIEQAAEEISDITLFSERECPQGQVRNTQTNECETDQTGIAECPQGQVRNLANECVADRTGIADCPQGQVRNTQTNECEQAPCADNEIRNAEGQCVVGECPQGEVKNAQTNECEQAPCADNEIRNAEGQCVVGTCPQGEVKNAADECVPESTDGGVDEPLTYWTGLVESIYTGDGNTCVILGEYSSADGLAYLEDGTYSEIRCWGYNVEIGPTTSLLSRTYPSPHTSFFTTRSVSLNIRPDNLVDRHTGWSQWNVATSIPKELPGLSGTAFKDFAASHGHYCKITASNAIICYGDNEDFQLGIEVKTDEPWPTGFTGIIEGLVYHWPEPEVGQYWKQKEKAIYALPVGHPNRYDNPPTIEAVDYFWTDSDPYWDAVARQGGVKGGIASETPVSLHTGKGITCAITASDKVFCWGSSSFCISNIRTATDEGGRFPPFAPCEYTHLSVEIPELSGQRITQLAIGHKHMCALWPRSTTGGADNNVKCWGNNSSSQLGARHGRQSSGSWGPSISKSDTPVSPHDPNNLLQNAKKIVAGSYHTCAITATDTVACWGYWGGSSLIHSGVSQVSGPTNVVDLFAYGPNTCWVTSADIVSCVEGTVLTPLLKDVHIPEGVKSMSVGAGHICIMTNTNTVKCAANLFGGGINGGSSVILGLERGAAYDPNTLYEVRIPYNGDS